MRSFCLLPALIAFALLLPLPLALTPEDFSQRLGNIELLSGSEQPLVPAMKQEYSLAYEAKIAGDEKTQELHYQELMLHFDNLQPRTDIPLKPLKDLVITEIGNPIIPVLTPPPVFMPKKVAVANVAPTVIVNIKKSQEPGRLIPTIPPEQLKGRKNVLYALGDILWENSAIIGVALIGVLVIYALYARQEEESTI